MIVTAKVQNCIMLRRDFLHHVFAAGASVSLVSRATAAEIAYTVPGNVPVIAQPNVNLCWAATAAILASWRDGTTYTPKSITDRVGRPYTELFATNTPLPGSD